MSIHLLGAMAETRLSLEQRRIEIINAATPLFARKGFARTKTREIAEAAGVSEALLYKHFPSKEAIYQEILRNCCASGDPVLERTQSLEPSTSTLVHVVYLLTFRLVMEVGATGLDWETRHRLMINSLLEDGAFAGLVFETVTNCLYPAFESSLQAAEKAGDLVPSPVAPVNRFWFTHHLGAIIAYVQLPKKLAPHLGAKRELVDQAVWFILRGIGLKDAAIAANYHPANLARLHS